MPLKHSMTPLDMTSLHKPTSHCDSTSTSPYPPTSPSTTDSDDEDCLHTSKLNVRSSVAGLPDFKLRSILIKLADTNPRFQRAIMKELTYAQSTGASPPISPAPSPKPRKSNRNKRKRRSGEPCPSSPRSEIQLPTPPMLHHRLPEELTYHPGYLDAEVYEFLPRTPEEATSKVMRTITMWSCCDEDEWSPGCMLSPSYVTRLQHHEHAALKELSHRDVFPDSDLERRHDVLAASSTVAHWNSVPPTTSV